MTEGGTPRPLWCPPALPPTPLSPSYHLLPIQKSPAQAALLLRVTCAGAPWVVVLALSPPSADAARGRLCPVSDATAYSDVELDPSSPLDAKAARAPRSRYAALRLMSARLASFFAESPAGGKWGDALAFISSHRTLLSLPCSGCGNLLSLEPDEGGMLPPVLRPLNAAIGGAWHPSCLPAERRRLFFI